MGKHQSASVGSVPFIYASIIAPVPDLINDQGGRVERPFSKAGIPIELVEEPEKVIPIPGYLGLLEAAAREEPDDASIQPRSPMDHRWFFGHDWQRRRSLVSRKPPWREGQRPAADRMAQMAK